MNEFSLERRRITEGVVREEQRITGLLAELRLTLSEGNKLIDSTDVLVKGLNLVPGGQTADTTAGHFDIKDYQATLKATLDTIILLHGLVKTIDQMGLEKMVPQIVNAAETLEKKSQEWVFLAFFLGIGLIVIFMIAAVIASLIYRRIANQKYGSGPQRSES